MVPGNEKNTCRHLQQLYHKQLIKRFVFVQGKNFTEFYYYLDNTEALDLFVDHGVNGDDLQWNEVRRNREKRYCDAIDPKRSADMQGQLAFLSKPVQFFGMLVLSQSVPKCWL